MVVVVVVVVSEEEPPVVVLEEEPPPAPAPSTVAFCCASAAASPVSMAAGTPSATMGIAHALQTDDGLCCSGVVEFLLFTFTVHA